jgi:hypothetical protein
MIGKVITTLLKANADLTDIVPGDRIFPYMLNESTPLPGIVYTIEDVTPQYTKDGLHNDVCSFTIVSVSDNYNQLQDIVYQVREAVETEQGEYDGVRITRIIMTGQDEAFSINENVFINRLRFSTSIIY